MTVTIFPDTSYKNPQAITLRSRTKVINHSTSLRRPIPVTPTILKEEVFVFFITKESRIADSL